MCGRGVERRFATSGVVLVAIAEAVVAGRIAGAVDAGQRSVGRDALERTTEAATSAAVTPPLEVVPGVVPRLLRVSWDASLIETDSGESMNATGT